MHLHVEVRWPMQTQNAEEDWLFATEFEVELASLTQKLGSQNEAVSRS